MNDFDLPQGFIEQLAPVLGALLPDFLQSFSAPPCRGIRLRPGLSLAAWRRAGEEGLWGTEDACPPVPWAENAWYLPLNSQAGTHPLHEAGAYYLQEPSAMAAAAALHPLPGDRVLDLCAAPGGKSTQLAAYLQGRGLLMCNEPIPSRAQILSRNMERMGVSNAVVVSALPEELSPRWPGYFDRVLVDAPCSGEGMFRRHPETRGEWTAAAPAGCAQRQAFILAHAAKMVRPGGHLCYSTCTFNAQENEGVIQGFLAAHPDFSLEPFALPGLPPCEGMLRLWPHRIRGEGHFAALMRRGEAPAGETPRSPRQDKPGNRKRAEGADAFSMPDPKMLEIAQAFLKEHFARAPGPNLLFAGRLVHAPEELPPLRGVRVLRLGLCLGEARGGLFLPDHALALAVPGLAPLPVEEAAARAYQKGSPLPAPDGKGGWRLIALGGVQLGWVKAAEGWLKNHYPKGLRK